MTEKSQKVVTSSFKVKEIFYTLQGEGFHSGRAAVFCRFSGCNLWSGLEKDRATAKCNICDTDFVGGNRYTKEQLSEELCKSWLSQNPNMQNAFVVFTGGEPGLQLTSELVLTIKTAGFYTAVETNGTCKLPNELDWVCLSPKTTEGLAITKSDELKVVFPVFKPEQYKHIATEHRYISPQDEFRADLTLKNQKLAADYCMRNSSWKLSLQSHKVVGFS